MPRSKLRGCSTCRQRHIRCDRASPSCSNCLKARPPKACDYGGLRIRQSSYSIKKQRNQETTTQDPGPADSSNPVTQNIPSPPAGPIWPALFPVTASECISRGVGHDSALWALQSQDLDTTDNVPSTEPDFTSGNFLGSLEHVQPPVDAQSPSVARSGCSPTTPESLNLNRLRVPSLRKIVTQTVEQSLFEFYISDAGPWLDIASSSHHFGQTVPRLALSQPVLYWACLAYSSHVLFLHKLLNQDIHEQFQNRAIEILIPLLSPDDTSTADETLMATAVILRMSEQFSELAEDAQHHLRGAYSLFATACDKWSPACVDMRGASFWTFVRETIRLCFLNEQSFQFSLDKIDDKLPEESDPEEAWANYMSFLLAKLCNTCWGDMDADIKESTRKEIKKCMEEWKSRLPSSYSPWYFVREDYKPFPVLKFLSPWHELAWQQYYTAKVMIAVYGSPRPQGPTILGLNRYLEDKILEPARLVCGVCFSSARIGCNINGGHLISWCGQFFSGKEDQRVLASFLRDFMDETRWPNWTCYHRLDQIWRGKRTTWTE